VSRRAYRDEFVSESVEKLLIKFIGENLLVGSSEYSNPEEIQASNSKRLKQSATVEIAHEILLSSWDELKRWLEQEKDAIILKNWLAGETRRWQKIRLEDESKAQDELLKGYQLAKAVELRKNDAFKNLDGLRPEESEFIDASVNWQQQQEQQKKNRRRNTIVSLATFSVISLGLASFAGIQLLNVKKAKQSTQEGLIRSAWISLKPSKCDEKESIRGFRYLYCIIKEFDVYRQLILSSDLLIFKEGGPHDRKALNLDSADKFGYYNPEFLEWIQKKAINPNDGKFKEPIQLAYNDKIKVVARSLYQTHKILFPTPEGSDEFKAIKKKYQDHLIKQNLPKYYFEDKFWELVQKEDTPKHITVSSRGFWVRRSIDGTEKQFFDILTQLLEIYDSEWLDEQNLLDTNPSQLKPRNMIKKMTHDDKLPTK